MVYFMVSRSSCFTSAGCTDCSAVRDHSVQSDGLSCSSCVPSFLRATFDQLVYRNCSVVVLKLHRPSALLGFQIGGNVGHSFIRDYRVTLDLNRSVMKLKKI